MYTYLELTTLALQNLLLLVRASRQHDCSGSTSWTFNINKLTHHAVESLLKIAYETTKFPLNWKVGLFFGGLNLFSYFFLSTTSVVNWE
jgi:hypothetical protein